MQLADTLKSLNSLRNAKTPHREVGGFQEIRRRPTLPGGDPQVPSAQMGLTSVFGMGTGVTPSPKPPETVRLPTFRWRNGEVV